jgi:hypothetical protein
LTDDFNRAQAILRELADLKEQADDIERKRKQLIGQLREMRRARETPIKGVMQQERQPATEAVRSSVNPTALEKIRGAVATMKEE